MTTCIYGTKSYPEGSTICVNGRGLKCVLGEWVETGSACTEVDELVEPSVSTSREGSPHSPSKLSPSPAKPSNPPK